MHWLLSLELIDDPVLVLVPRAVAVVSFVAAVLVVPRRGIRLAVGVAAGAATVFAAGLLAQAAGAFDGPLPGLALWWGAAGGAGVGAGVVAVLTAPWARRVLGVVLIVTAVLVAAIGINRAYGMTHTLASILGVQSYAAEALPERTPATGPDGTSLASWHPPADMPAQGRVSALSGDQRIPVGDFASARDAALYLPPAALVDHPPVLPVLVFMMGQPGSPDPGPLATALDAFAAAHEGLAPIALVVDQLGAPDRDPACRDSAMYGAVSTYINALVPAFVAQHLNASADHAQWIIGGYSNGGSCAIAYAAEDPELWGGLIDVSGNEYPGSEHVDQTVKDVFGGDRAAFDASIPTAVMAAHPGAYDGHPAVFTRGSEDTVFGPGQDRNAAAARAAGFEVTETTIAGAGHVGAALTAGLAAALDDIAPALGLTAASG